MSGAQETLRELLESTELKFALSEALYTGIDSASQFQCVTLADHIEHARGNDVSGSPFEALHENIAEALRSHVINKLPQPPPITLEDLVELFIAHMAGVDLHQEDNDQFVSQTYRRFVTLAVLELEQERVH